MPVDAALKVVNMHEAKTHLSKLVEGVSNGESFIIAKAGKPIAKVIPISEAKQGERVFGSLAGTAVIPEDFDRWMEDEIAEMFGVND